MQFLQKYVIEELQWKSSKLKHAYLDLQNGYRSKQKVGYSDIEQIQSYVFTRFPATYSVCLKLFNQYLSTTSINSILDWGCGVGTASLALSQIFKNLEYFLVEQDALAKNYAEQFLKHFFPSNSLHTSIPDNIDLSVFSYSLGEVESWEIILDEIWPKTEYLLIIEPGTPKHFDNLLKIRNYMLLKGAHIWGPCCHTKECPLLKNDWCHFGLKVERSKDHRLLKDAKLGYEQEAYSYLFFAKKPVTPDFGRIVSKPRIHGGHINLKLCNQEGEIVNKIFGRSMHEYKYLKKKQWGDCVE